MAVPGQRGAGGRGGDRHRGNKGSFRAAGGRVPPPPKRPAVSGKGGGMGCPLSVLAPVALLLAVLAWACS